MWGARSLCVQSTVLFEFRPLDGELLSRACGRAAVEEEEFVTQLIGSDPPGLFELPAEPQPPGVQLAVAGQLDAAAVTPPPLFLGQNDFDLPVPAAPDLQNKRIVGAGHRLFGEDEESGGDLSRRRRTEFDVPSVA